MITFALAGLRLYFGERIVVAQNSSQLYRNTEGYEHYRIGPGRPETGAWVAIQQPNSPSAVGVLTGVVHHLGNDAVMYQVRLSVGWRGQDATIMGSHIRAIPRDGTDPSICLYRYPIAQTYHWLVTGRISVILWAAAYLGFARILKPVFNTPLALLSTTVLLCTFFHPYEM